MPSLSLPPATSATPCACAAFVDGSAAERFRIAPLDRRLLEQYFNTWCRETGRFDPRVADGQLPDESVRAIARDWRERGHQLACVSFPHDGSTVVVALDRFSGIGFHRLAPYALWWSPQHGAQPCEGPAVFAEAIAQALAVRAGLDAQGWPTQFAALMHDSIERVRGFHRDVPREHARALAAGAAWPSPFVEAEQSLRFGHAFHVTSKATSGFDDHDVAAYAPERRAAFRLHYFAVASRRFESRSIDRAQPPIDPEAMHAAAALLGESEYRLLPSHPWQAGWLLAREDVQAMLKTRDLISLGPMGELAWPTSSVRTVWLPRQRRFLKLPLDVRITNFIRNNPPEQAARALDASRYLACLPRRYRQSPGFEILLDHAHAGLATADEALRASSLVIYREAMRDDAGDQARVLASVVEERPDGGTLLQALLHEALGETPSPARLAAWWRAYLDVMLLPMLRLFAHEGVSLEAHLQNAMVAFRAGWPARGYARDMEGASISRARCRFPDRLDAASPALYDEEVAWKRFLYYVLVNQVGHLAASVARAGYGDEATLWRLTAEAWADSGEPALLALLGELVRRPGLPAKANMSSCFGRHGELPAWVEIPNPLFGTEVRA
ncbi:IucA/IucC family protein [Burkholderia sp. Cy-637]|uniref:IucA/IucC family protein n=1 Tax=Burkholderia sp. Cy-637 TaxID=2608327 RepID=UPI001420C2E5|nr:IucA/IucC family protein [Burkholderia sp. Cy-637]NIF93366.1 IucA/IucC family siderophore biosynthesis protein [Burkholderia sp. Cy-637]